MSRSDTNPKEAGTENPTKDLCTKDYYQYMSNQISREDDLVNARITWMLTFEGILFASLALLGEKDQVREELYDALKYVLPVLGAAVAFLGYISVEAWASAIKPLKAGWEDKQIGIEGMYPRAFGNKFPHRLASLYSRLLPLAVAVAWGVILWFLVCRA